MTMVLSRRSLIQGWMTVLVALLVGTVCLAGEVMTTTPEIDKHSDNPSVTWMPRPSPCPDSAATTEAEMKNYAEKSSSTAVPIDMVTIKGGKFKMGSPAGEAGRNASEGPQREVKISPFWMGKYEITWEQYESWAMELDRNRRKMQNEPSTEWDKVGDCVAWPTKPYTDMSFGFGKRNTPAVCMTQYAAKFYCKWLTAKTGRYYRLPTEADWEYACRAGTTTAYSFGDDPAKLKDYAWFTENSEDKYQKVGLKKPNPWGLYDMHGNVMEWVLDMYTKDGYPVTPGKALIDPIVEPTKEFSRSVRGGSWVDEAEKLRSATRVGSTKDWKTQDPQIPQSIWYLTDGNFLGFRVVRPLKTPTEAEARLYEPDPKVRHEYVTAKGGRI